MESAADRDKIGFGIVLEFRHILSKVSFLSLHSSFVIIHSYIHLDIST